MEADADGDAIPTVFEHCPVVIKRNASAPPCTPGPVRMETIALDHSYNVKGDTGIIHTNSE